MRILWITNSPLSLICPEIGYKSSPTGGWIISLLNSLQETSNNLEFAVATVIPLKELFKKKINNIIFYCVPGKQYNTNYDKSLESYWKYINDDFIPDVVHIHGSEYVHGLAYIKSCGSENVILSIQGLVSVICKYYLAGISRKEIWRNITLRDIIKGGINYDLRNLRKASIYENKYICSINHVIGRTSWDMMHVKAINNNINYHFCNETLRNSFYNKNKWNLDNCEKYSIFVSQATTPLKGLHKLLEALPLIINKYPNTKLYIAGRILYKENIYERLKNSTYANIITRIINNNKIKEHIHFVGYCDEEKMVKQYLRSNVFVCPSSIENSPNSLGEAQILGVPCVAAYVGGIPDMIQHGINGFLYRFEETVMLANYICEIFSNNDLALKISNAAILTARKRHDKDVIVSNILSIYKEISKK